MIINEIVPKVVQNIVLPLVEFVFALAFVVFIWGLLGFFMNGEDTAKRANGQRHILWGVVGFVIMVSVYGIIRLVATTVGQSSVLPF